jgi:hypothetical protein
LIGGAAQAASVLRCLMRNGCDIGGHALIGANALVAHLAPAVVAGTVGEGRAALQAGGVVRVDGARKGLAKDTLAAFLAVSVVASAVVKVAKARLVGDGRRVGWALEVGAISDALSANLLETTVAGTVVKVVVAQTVGSAHRVGGAVEVGRADALSVLLRVSILALAIGDATNAREAGSGCRELGALEIGAVRHAFVADLLETTVALAVIKVVVAETVGHAHRVGGALEVGRADTLSVLLRVSVLALTVGDTADTRASGDGSRELGALEVRARCLGRRSDWRLGGWLDWSLGWRLDGRLGWRLDWSLGRRLDWCVRGASSGSFGGWLDWRVGWTSSGSFGGWFDWCVGWASSWSLGWWLDWGLRG